MVLMHPLGLHCLLFDVTAKFMSVRFEALEDVQFHAYTFPTLYLYRFCTSFTLTKNLVTTHAMFLLLPRPTFTATITEDIPSNPERIKALVTTYKNPSPSTWLFFQCINDTYLSSLRCYFL